MKIIDLRSDTVTKPSPEMWSAVKSLTNNDLGDDVAQEDPTVNELEQKAAKIAGKDAALFVTSGTMGNLVSILTHTQPGQEIILEELSHIYLSEVGGLGRLGGLIAKPFVSDRGKPNWDIVEKMVNDGSNIHHAQTGLLCVENTHNYHGGVVLSPEIINKGKIIAQKKNIPFHMDGARIFNAAVALNLPLSDFTQHIDTIQFCLSKGLSCPVGSIIAGSRNFIERARKTRKMLGGGWRQAGILAAMGLEALKPEWINRLKEDHENAKVFAEEIQNLNPSLSITPVESNIFFINFSNARDPQRIKEICEKKRILIWGREDQLRIVTHYGIREEDAINAGKIIGNVIKSMLN